MKDDKEFTLNELQVKWDLLEREFINSKHNSRIIDVLSILLITFCFIID